MLKHNDEKESWLVDIDFYAVGTEKYRYQWKIKFCDRKIYIFLDKNWSVLFGKILTFFWYQSANPFINEADGDEPFCYIDALNTKTFSIY